METKRALNRNELRQKRLDDLISSCREQTLQRIIGPFGLTPAMFEDKVGGNVTTDINARKGIFAKETEELDRDDYSYDTAKRRKMNEAVKDGSMNSQEFTDAYTGLKESTRRLDGNGKPAMNAELDHVIPVKELHRSGGWMRDQEGRKELSSVPENLQFTKHETNRAKGGKAADEFLSSENGFDESITTPIIEKAKDATEDKLPTQKERVLYHGKELLSTGVTEAGKTALRRALGMLMYEFVNGSYLEVSRIVKEPETQKSLIDQIIVSLKKVLERVQNKLGDVFDALVAGGAQGFISNLLTFVINSVITTSAKVVTIIRESMKGLWDAIKLIVSPPAHLSAQEVARQATKIIAAVITVSLGMLLEESVKGFIMSIPFLVPFADAVASVVTGILTGLMTALVTYSIDRLFDYLSATDTEFLEAQLAKAEADAAVIEKLSTFIEQQYRNSHLYAGIAEQNAKIMLNFKRSEFSVGNALSYAQNTQVIGNEVIETFTMAEISMRKMDDELVELLDQYQITSKP